MKETSEMLQDVMNSIKGCDGGILITCIGDEVNINMAGLSLDEVLDKLNIAIYYAKKMQLEGIDSVKTEQVK